MLQMVCNGCGRVAEQTEDALLWLTMSPAIGEGELHACSATCSDNVSRDLIGKMNVRLATMKAQQEQEGGLSVAQGPDIVRAVEESRKG